MAKDNRQDKFKVTIETTMFRRRRHSNIIGGSHE